MRLSEIDPNVVRGAGAVIGMTFGRLGATLADRLPRRYGITHLVTASRRSRRNVVLVALAAACGAGIAHVLIGAPALSVPHAAFLLVTHALVATAVLAAAAVDLE